MREEFEELRSGTKCPFAKRAKVVFASVWSDDVDFQTNVDVHAQELCRFSSRVEGEQLHGFVSEVRTPSEHPSLEEVRRRFGQYLFALANTDLSCRRSMDYDFLGADWQFTHSDTRYFLNVFSGCYPPTHSKNINMRGRFLVFFQPERSFDFCGSVSLEVVKYRIRSQFEAAGMPYNGAQIDERIESLIYMFPARPSEPPIKWWD